MGSLALPSQDIGVVRGIRCFPAQADHSKVREQLQGVEGSMNKRVPNLIALLLLSLWGRCGSYSPHGGVPLDPWDPGPRPPGGGYGSGSGGSGGPPPPPMCEEARRRCGREFVYRGVAGMPTQGDERSVELRGSYRAGAWVTGDALKFDGSVWRGTVDVPWQTKFLYKLRIVDAMGMERWIADPENPMGEPDGFGGTNSVLSGVMCPVYTCVDAVPMCDMPASVGYDWRDAVMYFVFVDRFFDGNPANNLPSGAMGLDPSANWHGGDWAGLTAKIKDGYFGRLGVNTLWLTVPMDNTDATGLGDDGRLYTAYHGYWPRDLSKSERRFGELAELKLLVDEAHKAGLKVLVDYAMNHVHRDSPTYAAHQADGWFNPLDLGGGKQCICGAPDCGWDDPVKSKVCWFRDYLPDFNFNTAAARQFSVDNAMKWMVDYNLDGFRLDAVKHIELSWLTDLRARLTAEVESKTKQHVYLVGETFTGNRDVIRQFVDPCTKLDGQFDFPMRIEVVSKLLMRQGKMQDLRAFFDGNDTFYGSGLMSTFLGNHDVPRTIHFAQNTPLWGNVWDGGKDRNFGAGRPAVVAETEAYERMALGMALLFSQRGVPLIYYGDEIGLAGAGDPDNRRDMNWSVPSYTMGQQLLLNRHIKLAAIRKAHPALRRGLRTTLSVTDDTWAFKMVDGTDVVYVLLNRSDSSKTLTGLPSASLKDELLGDGVVGPDIAVPARSARMLVPLP